MKVSCAVLCTGFGESNQTASGGTYSKVAPIRKCYFQGSGLVSYDFLSLLPLGQGLVSSVSARTDPKYGNVAELKRKAVQTASKSLSF